MEKKIKKDTLNCKPESKTPQDVRVIKLKEATITITPYDPPLPKMRMAYLEDLIDLEYIFKDC